MNLVGLHPVDSKMANLALMKISSWYKSMGLETELFQSLNSPLYISVSVSILYNFTPIPRDILCDNVEYGGTGYDVAKQLPDEIENGQPDYSIYPNCRYTIQLFSRGCPRKCKFCVVPEKEGGIRSINPLRTNPNGGWVEVLDNNFFANPEWKEAIKWLESHGQPVNFHGVDARLLTDEMCHVLLKLKHKKQIHMAWDNVRYNINWESIIKIIPAHKIMVYILIGFDSTEKEDLYRIERLRSLKIDPFVMPYNKHDGYQRSLARWVNHKAIFNSVGWKDYNRGVPTGVAR